MIHQLGEKQETVIELARKAGVSLREFLRDTKRRWIVQELQDSGFNQCAAARRLGKHRNTLDRDIDELEIPVGQLRFDWQQSQRKPLRAIRDMREHQRRQRA